MVWSDGHFHGVQQNGQEHNIQFSDVHIVPTDPDKVTRQRKFGTITNKIDYILRKNFSNKRIEAKKSEKL